MKAYQKSRKRRTMRSLKTDAGCFENFDTARYPTHVTVQQLYHPSGNVAERKQFNFEKHILYGNKVRFSVLPLDISIVCAKRFPGTTSNLKIFSENVNFIWSGQSTSFVILIWWINGCDRNEYLCDHWEILTNNASVLLNKIGTPVLYETYHTYINFNLQLCIHTNPFIQRFYSYPVVADVRIPTCLSMIKTVNSN